MGTLDERLIDNLPHFRTALGDVAILRKDAERLQDRLDTAKLDFAALKARAEKAEANYQFMIDRIADEKLDGYRELGRRAASAESRAEKAEARVSELDAAILEADLMPMYSHTTGCPTLVCPFCGREKDDHAEGCIRAALEKKI